jgi:hypothetical protein
MDRTPVSSKSENVRAVGYDAETRMMEVEFVNGAVYDYYGVPDTVPQALISAGSAGQYFNQNVRGKFLYEKIA